MVTPTMKAIAPVTSQNREPLMALPGSMFAPCSSHISPNMAMIAPTIERARRFIHSLTSEGLSGLLLISRRHVAFVLGGPILAFPT